LPPKFLLRRSRAMKGTLMLDAGDFRLQGVGGSVAPALLFNTEAPLPDTRFGVTMTNLSDNQDSALPRERPPWTPEGQFAGEALKPIEMDSPEFGGGSKKVKLHIGAAHFKGKRGMEVNYKLSGGGVELSWDGQSRGYLAGTKLEYIDRFTVESLIVEC